MPQDDSGFADERGARVRRLRRLDVCSISDALDQLELGGVVSGVPQWSGGRGIAGAIVTVKVGVGAAGAGRPRHLGTHAIEIATADHVIVVEQRSGIVAGCWGGLLTLAARLRGIPGVIADGPVRDIDEARASDFPIFASGLTARTARGRVRELGVNVPISPWDIAIEAEDYVIADRSGIAFLERESVDVVLDRAEAIAAREALMAKNLAGGMAPSIVMGESYENMLRTEDDR